MPIPYLRPKIEPRKRDRRNGASWRRLQDGLRSDPSWDSVTPLSPERVSRQREWRDGLAERRQVRERVQNRIYAGLVALIVVSVCVVIALFAV